jgi:hypothetical protein
MVSAQMPEDTLQLLLTACAISLASILDATSMPDSIATMELGTSKSEHTIKSVTRC